MKPLLCLIALFSSCAVFTGAFFPVFAQSQSNSTQVRSMKRSRPSRGFPGNRTERASRGCQPVLPRTIGLTALAPEWADSPTLRKSVWGQTTVEHPTLWFFVPAAATQLEFSLQTQDEQDLYRTVLPAPEASGILSVQVPKTMPALQLNQPYRWTLKAIVPCASDEPKQTFVQGWIQRVAVSNPLAIESVSRGLQYAEQGIWYDAVTTIAESWRQRPADPKLRQAWTELLQSEQLEALIDQPVLKAQ